jgi:hypothetical protein
MAMLVIQTQVYENYGAHAWEGEGECPQYWKPKGGSEYKVPGVDLNADLQKLVDTLRPQVEADDHYWREYIISWSVEADDYLSQFERDQLKWDGKISHPDKVLQVA